MPNTSILEVVENVQKIVDCMRCMICDKLGGAQYRLPCGHAGCDQCLKESIECLLCLTPPNKPSVLDITLTQQVRNVEALLKVCQDTFDIEVLNNKRASEKLRIEKEIFPECIQASVKYFNKRKSTNNSKDKENIIPTNFPGENISPIKDLRMENSKTNVEMWFQMNEKGVRKRHPRKPFGDLVANNQNILSCSNINNPLRSRAKLILNKVNSLEKDKEAPKPVCSRKRSHTKTSEKVGSRINLDKYITLCSGKKSKKEIKNGKENTGVCKNDKNESGIEVDDELIVIEDTQSPIIDKDREAWLAVLEAEKNRGDASDSIIRSDNSDVMESSNAKINVETKQSTSKVPFYKKSQLMDDFGVDHTSTVSSQTNGDKSNVSITVENESFVVSITVSQADRSNVESKTCDKSSVSVQTDIDIEKNNDTSVLDVAAIKKLHHSNLEDSGIELNNASKIVRRHSHDLFITEDKFENCIKETEEFCEKLPSSGHVIIEDSDSDIDLTNCSSLIEVTAEVHRASDEIEDRVLRQMSPNDNRWRRGPRGPSPGTSDSSDKENYDPNKMKRLRLHKKFAKKK